MLTFSWAAVDSGETEMVTLIEIAAATLVVGYAASYLTMRHLFPPARS